MQVIIMVKTSLYPQTKDLIETVRRFIRIKHRFAPVLPADLAALRERLLDELPRQAGSRRDANFDLFFRIGAILSDRAEPVTMGELSDALAAPISTVTRMVDWLVRSNYAARQPDPRDRRLVRVALTDSGRRLHDSINEFVSHRIEQVLGRLTSEERDDLVALLRKAVDILEEEAGTPRV